MSKYFLLFIALVGGCVSTAEEHQVATRGFFNQNPKACQLTPREEGLLLVQYLSNSSDEVDTLESRNEVLETMDFNASCLDRLAELKQQGHINLKEFQTASFGYMESELALFDSRWAPEFMSHYENTFSKQ
jgi:hypothetical protein